MAEYISKEETLNIIPQYPLNYSHEQVEAFMKGFYQLYCSVKTEKAADVRPVVHGHWEKRMKENETPFCKSFTPIWSCSECKTEYDPSLCMTLNFCPNCGCDMRETDEARRLKKQLALNKIGYPYDLPKGE